VQEITLSYTFYEIDPPEATEQAALDPGLTQPETTRAMIN
jgi:cytochrome c oxidase assembly protein Cox11